MAAAAAAKSSHAEQKETSDLCADCYELDILTVAQTKMANERTLLAYISTALGFLATGVALFKLVPGREFMTLGYILLGIAPVLALVGAVRYIKVNRFIKASVCIGQGKKC